MLNIKKEFHPIVLFCMITWQLFLGFYGNNKATYNHLHYLQFLDIFFLYSNSYILYEFTNILSILTYSAFFHIFDFFVLEDSNLLIMFVRFCFCFVFVVLFFLLNIVTSQNFLSNFQKIEK